jgi:hypothetical protein
MIIYGRYPHLPNSFLGVNLLNDRTIKIKSFSMANIVKSLEYVEAMLTAENSSIKQDQDSRQSSKFRVIDKYFKKVKGFNTLST